MNVSGGPFAVLRQIGGSATNEVLLAAQYGLAGVVKLVVLKRLRPEALDNPPFVRTFVQQARLASAFDHGNIITTYDVHEDAQDVYIALEYVSGEDLAYLLGQAESGALKIPVGIACRLIAQAAEAVQYIHSAVDPAGDPLGLTHWDLQPGHVMVSYTGITKLLNTGLAKSDPQDAYAIPGTLKHRLAYRAPERLRYGAADSRADVYSLGVLLHELLSGRRLFRHTSNAELVKLAMEHRVAPPSKTNDEVPPELDDLALAALERDPERRLQSAHELQARIEQILSQNPRTMGEDLGHWMQSALRSRYAERQQTEQNVKQEALSGSYEANPGEIPQLFALPSAGTASHSGSSASGSVLGPRRAVDRPSGGLLQGGSSRALVVMLLASLATLMAVTIFGLAFYFGQGAISGTNERSNEAALWVHVRPVGAKLSVDGKLLTESIDSDGILVAAKPGTSLQLEASRPGYQPQRALVSAPERATKEIYLSLSTAPSEGKVGSPEPATVVLAPLVKSTRPAAPPSAELQGDFSRLVLFVLLPLAGLIVGGGLGGLIVRRVSRSRNPIEAKEQQQRREVSHVTNDADQLRSQLALARARAEALESEVSRLEGEQRTGSPGQAESSSDQVTRLEAQIEAHRGETARSQEEFQRIEFDAEEWRSTAERDKAELERVRGDLSEMQAGVEAAAEQIAQNREKLAQAEEEAARNRRQRDEFEAAVRELREQLEQMQNDLSAKQGQLDSIQRNAAAQKDATETDADKAREELDQKKVALNKARSQVDALKTELRAAREHRVALEKARSEVDALDKELKKTRKRHAGDRQAAAATRREEPLTVGVALEEDPNLSFKQRQTIRMLYQGFMLSRKDS